MQQWGGNPATMGGTARAEQSQTTGARDQRVPMMDSRTGYRDSV